jgi:hypothetical protein
MPAMKILGSFSPRRVEDHGANTTMMVTRYEKYLNTSYRPQFVKKDQLNRTDNDFTARLATYCHRFITAYPSHLIILQEYCKLRRENCAVSISINTEGVLGLPNRFLILHNSLTLQRSLVGSHPLTPCSEPVAYRAISSDLMEAIHLGDPGWWLLLESGLRFYLWRCAVLKQMGKMPNDRIFPNIPSFGLSFPSSMSGRGNLSDAKCHATYGYCYDSWYKTIFNQDSFAYDQFLNITFWPIPRKPGSPMPVGFRTTCDYAGTVWLKSRDIVEATALLNAAADTGFWFDEVPYAFWNPNVIAARKYATSQIWKPAIGNDPGALERQQTLINTMQQQRVALNNQPNIPILPVQTIEYSTITQHQSAPPSQRNVETLIPEKIEIWNDLFSFGVASGEIESSLPNPNQENHVDPLNYMATFPTVKPVSASPVVNHHSGMRVKDVMLEHESSRPTSRGDETMHVI